MIFPKDRFVSFLRELADLVETGDSLEGTIAYTALNSPVPLLLGELEVEYAVRVGNKEGQGGIRLTPRREDMNKEKPNGQG